MEFPKRLIDGYTDFLSERLPREQTRFRELAEAGQRPEIMVIGCCDSRVSPEVIFDAGPGELFVLRNIANVVPPYQPDAQAHGVSAALEFAVLALQVKHIVILGHARCGGVQAFAQNAEPLTPSDFIGNWMKLMAPAAERTPRGDLSDTDYLTKLEHANVINSIENLMTFPRVAARINSGELIVHGAYFGVATGQLSVLDRNRGAFVPVASEQHAKAFGAPRF
ncbi:MAG TPA: carbonic anhydrase [Pseudolabrys sp.]|nr:carbonic anhydrase [Pseudolabrys sp.]